MLPVHTFQQYRAFALRQETGGHRLIHGLAVGIDVVCEGRVAKSERHHADFGDMYRHAVRPMPNLPFKGYGKLCSSNPHIHVAELFGEEPELLTRTVVPSVDPDVRAVFACLRVLDVEHESVFVCDCPIGFHPRAGKPYRLRRLTADQEYRRANRVDLVYGKLRGSDDESFPCPLQTSQHGQIGAEIVAGGCLDVAVTELSCDH